jgi:predicted transcriptional regulator
MNAKRSTSHLAAIFGPLEIRVLEALWARGTAASVRDLQPQFPGVAYTTLMTTLDRLFRKGTLSRFKDGRAFFYQPTATHDQLMSELAGSALSTLLPGDTSAMRPILSMFVDTVGRRDHALLDELEALIRVRRDELKGREPR